MLITDTHTGTRYLTGIVGQSDLRGKWMWWDTRETLGGATCTIARERYFRMLSKQRVSAAKVQITLRQTSRNLYRALTDYLIELV